MGMCSSRFSWQLRLYSKSTKLLNLIDLVLFLAQMRPLLAAGNLKAAVDPSLGENYNIECMWKIAELGMMSVEPKSFNRPTMTDAVLEIRDAIAIEETVQAPTSPSSLSSVASPGL